MKKPPKPVTIVADDGYAFTQELLNEFRQVFDFVDMNNGNQFPILKLQQKALRTSVFKTHPVWLDVPIVTREQINNESQPRNVLSGHEGENVIEPKF